MDPHYDNGVVRLYTADCRRMDFLADGSVDMVCCSPPYWGLRDYSLPPTIWDAQDGCEHEWRQGPPAPTKNATQCSTETEKYAPIVGTGKGQAGSFCALCGAWRGTLGLEPTPELYVRHLTEIFREVWRVLKPWGTVWLNMGDSYNSVGHKKSHSGFGTTGLAGGIAQEHSPLRRENSAPGLKHKDLVGIPWRVAFALQEDGWWLRCDIIWAKPNPMPESVTDRPTRSHEYLFLLTKAERYYYDQEAVREPAQNWGARDRTRWAYTSDEYRKQSGDIHRGGMEDGDYLLRGRNRRSVWTIATQPYAKAHFAVFPEALVAPCILAGTSERGNCAECGRPWQRVVKKSRSFESGSGRSGNLPVGKNGPRLQGGGETIDVRRGPVVTSETLGWRPTCSCGADTGPAVVLDPFSGAGTVCLVAQKLGRRGVGVDLSEEYGKLAAERLGSVPLPLGLQP